MNLSFYGSLNADQKAYANKIAQKARSMGIPPELAVSVAYQESRLNPGVQAGSAGEIGIMQIKPATAKEMGFSAEDIRDPDKNMDAGLKYLKKSLDMSDGDPRLAVVGYNAGINHPFFSSKDAALPPTTVNYLKDLKGYGAFTKAAPESAGSTAEPAMTADEVSDIFEAGARGKGELVGTAIGGGEAARRMIGPAVRTAARSLGSAAEEGRIAAQAKAIEDPRLARILQGTIEPDSGASGRARMSGFNIESAQQAARAKEAAETLGALQRSGAVAQGAPSVLANAPGLTASQSGVLYPRGAPSMPTPPSRGALEEVTSLFKSMIDPSTKLGTVGGALVKYGLPPLAGYQAGSETGALLSELEKEQPNYGKVISRGMGALGAAGSMFPLTAPIGIPLAITGPLMEQAIERGQGRPLGQMGEVLGP